MFTRDSLTSCGFFSKQLLLVPIEMPVEPVGAFRFFLEFWRGYSNLKLENSGAYDNYSLMIKNFLI